MRRKYKIKAKKLWKSNHIQLVKDTVDIAIQEYDLEGFGLLTTKFNFIREEFGSALSLGEDNHFIFISAHKSKKLLVQTVFHEMWHIRQYIYDGLDIEFGRTLWKGDEYILDNEGMKYQDYLNLPWEAEARKVEEEMYKKYRKTLKIS